MADENVNNNSNSTQGTGDVLGSVTGRSSTSKRIASIDNSLQSLDATAQEIKSQVVKLVASNKNSNASTFSTSVSDFASRSSASSNASSRKSSAHVATSSSKSSRFDRKTVVEHALDGFEETLCDYLGVPYIGDDVSKTVNAAFDKYAESLARSVGSSVDDLPKKLAAELTKRSIQSFASSHPNADKLIKEQVSKYKSSIGSFGKKLADKWNAAVNATVSDAEAAQALNVDSLLGKNSKGASQASTASTSSIYTAIPAENSNAAEPLNSKSIAFSAVDYWWDVYDDVIGIKVTDSLSDIVRGDKQASSDWASSKATDYWQNWFEKNPDAVEPTVSGESGLGDIAKNVASDLLNDSKFSDIAGTASSVTEATTPIVDVASSGASIGDLVDVASTFGSDIAGTVAGEVGTAASTAFDAVTPMLADAGTALVAAAPELAIAGAAIAGAVVIGKTVLGEFDKAAKHMSQAADKMGEGWNRADEMRWQNVEAQEKRFQQDAETFVRAPFKILEDAANKVYEVWDSALQTINATQGYNKADLQDLMTAYAQRLRSEGLSSVVGTTDVTSMLQQIINSGLSGKVAEEFAYQATILNKAIPTEDFSQYASSYASLASQYMSLGHSQEEALEYANAQLKMFASNVLTASREVSGGFTSSLTNVSNLFSDVVKISETGKSTNTAALSSALSTVQAVAGAVSPDVGNNLVAQIVNAAVGGNDNSLTALRSLAGTGASNTSFLQALVKNPSKVLTQMFTNLNSMLSNATDNYMEVAYSLSDTFGVSVDALTRVDWDKLVNALENSSSSSDALNQNMQLLASGETTTSAESQRLAQINEYMIDQGLSYVLDNESARVIQQHMWDQEIAEQLQEATYAVDFAGGALEFMTSIVGVVQNIWDFLTGQKLVNLLSTAVQSDDLKGDIAKLIEAGKVGNGNAQAYHDLTTYDVSSLSNVPNILDIWGKKSNYYDGLLGVNSYLNKDAFDKAGMLVNGVTNSLYQASDALQSVATASPSSMYTWSSAPKSVLTTFSSYTAPAQLAGISSKSASSDIASNTATAFNNWLSSMTDFVSQNKSYDEWYASAKDYGFSDVSSAAQQAGYSDTDLKLAYTDAITSNAIDTQAAGKQLENQFYQDAITWLEDTYPTNWEDWNTKYDTNVVSWLDTFTTQMSDWSTLYTDTMDAYQAHVDGLYKSWSDLYTETSDETHKNQKYLNTKFDESFIDDFLYEWKDYYIGNHTHYRNATNYDSALRTINSEKTQTGQAVLALAQSLTKNYEDLADPAVQTNVLLGQIVILLQSIFTAQQSGKGLTLPTSLAALGLNITKQG